jgi:hypothetical protein
MVFRSSGRQYFVSHRGHLGVGPSAMSPGNVIANILGLDTPLVLRAIEQDNYQIVGESQTPRKGASRRLGICSESQQPQTQIHTLPPPFKG